MRSARLLYNPNAGRFPAGFLLDRAVRVLSGTGWDVFVVESKPGQDLAELASDAVRDNCEAVFVAGGDGSVGRVAAALAGSMTALAVLPAGTANVWAQEMGLPRLDWAHWFALEEAAERLARGSVRLVDLGMCADRTFLLWAGVGLDGQIVNSIEPRGRLEKTFGTVHYGLSALWNSLNWTGIDLRVRCGHQVWEDRFLVAIASNIRSYAGGLMELSPDALVDDGLLDFWLITGRSMVDAVYRVVQVLLGMHVDAPGVTHFQADEAVFETPGALSMQFDGEPGIIPSPAEFRVRRRQLRVLMPAESAPEVFTASARAPGPPS